ncbi:MAG TPA: hypothetical protein VGB71_10885 [Flavisolibacter sp.]|jgi:hypothetical protein
MTQRIKSYEDLLNEEQRLTAQLATYKSMIKTDIASVKDGLNPIKKAKEKVKSLFTREDKNSPALNFTLNFVLDYIIRKIIPNRTGVFTKTVIPFIVKNYVSHLITDEQRQAISTKVNAFVAKIEGMIRKSAEKKQQKAYATANAQSHYEA